MSAIEKTIFNNLKARMKTKFWTLLQRYLKDSKAYMITIETNIPDGSLNDLIEAAHNLKSASGLLGIVHVYEHANRLEKEAKTILKSDAENWTSLSQHYKNLQNAFSETEGELNIELDRARTTLN